MTTQTRPHSRQQEIINLWEKYNGLYVVAGILIGMLMFPLMQMIVNNLSELLEGLVPEAVGIVFTVLILDKLAENRAIEQVKQRLILQLGSPDNDATKSAIRALWDYGSLQNGDVQNANLWGANLVRADLGQCDLRNVNLWHANLAGAWLWSTDLRGAYLRSANLRDAVMDSTRFGRVKFDETTVLPDGTCWGNYGDIDRFTNPDHPNFWSGYFSVGDNLSKRNLKGHNLSGSNLMNLNMRYANLTKIDLENASLRDVDLTNACLKHANLTNTIFIEVILPDSTRWAPDTDMSRYTDPNHPDFWQPDWVKEQEVD